MLLEMTQPGLDVVEDEEGEDWGQTTKGRETRVALKASRECVRCEQTARASLRGGYRCRTKKVPAPALCCAGGVRWHLACSRV